MRERERERERERTRETEGKSQRKSGFGHNGNHMFNKVDHNTARGNTEKYEACFESRTWPEGTEMSDIVMFSGGWCGFHRWERCTADLQSSRGPDDEVMCDSDLFAARRCPLCRFYNPSHPHTGNAERELFLAPRMTGVTKGEG